MTPRYSERKPVSAKVTICCGPRIGEGQVLDLTVPGCLLQTAMPLESGQSVQLAVYLDQLRPMRITLGVVRWASGKAAGVEFIRMSAEDQLRLRAHTGLVPRRAPVNTSWRESVVCTGVTGR